jgi:hypothetical protein
MSGKIDTGLDSQRQIMRRKRKEQVLDKRKGWEKNRKNKEEISKFM